MKTCSTCKFWVPSLTNNSFTPKLADGWKTCLRMAANGSEPVISLRPILAYAFEVGEDVSQVATHANFGCVLHEDAVGIPSPITPIPLNILAEAPTDKTEQIAI